MEGINYRNGNIDKARMDLWIKLYMEHQASNEEAREEYINRALVEFDKEFKKESCEDYGPM